MARHTNTCAAAKTRGCTCPCGHAKHGLSGRLQWAAVLSSPISVEEPDQKALLETVKQRQLAAKDWLARRIRQVKKSKRSRRLTRANVDATFEYTRTVQLVEWLVEHPIERKQLEGIVDLATDAFEDLMAAAPEGQRLSLRKRIADHLWCELITEIIRAIEKVAEIESKTKGQIADVISPKVIAALRTKEVTAPESDSTKTADFNQVEGKADEPEPQNLLESKVIEGFIRGVVGVALEGATAGFDAHREAILMKLRVAGIMLCPDAEKHVLVWEHCWIPLLGEKLKDELINAMVQFVPQFEVSKTEGKASIAQIAPE